MSFNIRICLGIFSVIWFLIILHFLKKEKLPVRYSLIWLVIIVSLFLISVVPQFVELIAKLFGFTTISNLLIGIILTMLMFITLSLSIIVSKQRKQIILLIQKVSMLESDKK